jgi:ACS family allantoate permease-like MFS transporter
MLQALIGLNVAARDLLILGVFSGSDFSWAVSLFYFGQLTSQYPSAYLISRFPVVKVVAVTIVLWGGMEMCLAAPQSAAGLCAVRFFLGLFEGASAPGFVVVTSNFYKRKEHPIRVAWWQSCSGLSQIIGALVMYGIGGADGLALQNWRVMFLICGSATITAGIVYFLIMPRDPSTAWFLKPDDRKIAMERLALDRATRDRSFFDARQVKEALMDVQTWLLFCMGLFICIPSPILKVSHT